MNTSAHVDTRSEASAMTDLDPASRPLTAYPHREKVLDLAEQAADAVDRDQASPFTTLQELGDLLPVSPTVEGETAERWRWADGSGHVGLISSVSRAFCGDCNRARLATDGRVFLCLFAREGADLRALLRSGAGDTTLLQAIGGLWSGRADRYSELRGQSHAASAEPRAGRVEMSFIGG